MTISTLSSSSSFSSSSSRRRNPQQQQQHQGQGGHNGNVITIPVHVSKERHHNALLGQLVHHRNRRLTLNSIIYQEQHEKEEEATSTRRSLQLRSSKSKSTLTGLELGGDNEEAQQSQSHFQDHQHDHHQHQHYHHPASWRQAHAHFASHTSTDQTRARHTRHLQSESDGGLITSIDLSNCHLVLYSGYITLGSPPHLQTFKVDFDTAGSDLWIPSTLCDTSCNSKHPTWNLYNPLLSNTYEVATSDPTKNAFQLDYEDGEGIKGEHAKDTLRLGNDDIRIDRQVFAQITHIDDFTTCEEEEGILGLANNMETSHGFPSVLGNLLHKSSNSNKVLKHNIFGMYLRSDIDDYTNFKQKFTNPNQDETDTDTISFTPRNPPQQPNSSSELILGGVNQDHYLGCLKWHNLLGNTSNGNGGKASGGSGSGNEIYDNYWAVQMNDVKVGGTSLMTSSDGSGSGDDSSSSSSNNDDDLIAVLDSGSSYIIGPQESVAHLVKLNNAKCFQLDNSNNKPIEIDCDNPDGFDGAILNNCNDPFFSIEFIINGIPYVLEKEDFIMHIDTINGDGDSESNSDGACILRIVPSKGMKGWVLGDAFLNKYYSVYDFENQKLGLAVAAENVVHDRCDTDLSFDVTNFWNTIYEQEKNNDEIIQNEQQDQEIQEQQQSPVVLEDDIIESIDGGWKDEDDLEDIIEADDGQDTDAENFPSLEGDILDDDTFEFPPPPSSESEGDDTVMIPPGGTPTKITQEEIEEWTNDVNNALNEEDMNTIEQQAEEEFNDIHEIEANNEDDNSNQQHNDNHNDNNNDATSLFDGSHGDGGSNTNDSAAADNGSSPSHVPSHFEPPNREPVPAVPGQAQGGSLSSSKTASTTSIGGIIGIFIVITLFFMIFLFVWMKRRKKYQNKKSIQKQQLLFQKTFQNAERSIVNQSRNLNYRDHNNQPSKPPPPSNSSQHFQDALDEIKYSGSSGSGGSSGSSGVGRFHDEEGGGQRSRGGGGTSSTTRTSPRSLIGSFSGGLGRSYSSSDDNDNNGHGHDHNGGQDQPDEVDFVLDSHILQRMN